MDWRITSLAVSIGLALAFVMPTPVLSEGRSANTEDLFVISSSTKTPDEVVTSMKKYSEEPKWQFLGANKVKQGAVTLVKVCIPEVGREIWPLGLHLGAMLPCGNLSVYQKDGRTEIALLHARYMEVLHPDTATKKASAIAQPLLAGMVEAAR